MNLEWRGLITGWYIVLVGVLTLALGACATDPGSETEIETQKESESSENGPAIDLTEPVDVKTATFALG